MDALTQQNVISTVTKISTDEYMRLVEKANSFDFLMERYDSIQNRLNDMNHQLNMLNSDMFELKRKDGK